jgi:hypothetical protein
MGPAILARRNSLRFMIVIVGFCMAVLAPASPPAMAAQQVACSGSIPQPTPGVSLRRCRIDEPIVTQRTTEYRTIVFTPGDFVTVQAGGCVQTGGHGATWKNYVEPGGSDSRHLFSGLIWIPGITAGLVRIGALTDRTVRVPLSFQSLPVSQMYLRLGYEDDDYSDNGYYDHDNGTDDQCRGIGNAYVELRIQHNPYPVPGFDQNSPSGTPAPFDLVANAWDANGLPENPQWGWQTTHTDLPNPDLWCPESFRSSQCTTQNPTIDATSGIGLHNIVCSIGARGSPYSFSGHVNWFPGTYWGFLQWDGHSDPIFDDDDYAIRMSTPNNAGLVDSNGGTLETEFNSDETVDHFLSPWWDKLHNAVQQDEAEWALALSTNREAPRRYGRTHDMIDNRKAFVTGLIGLDCEHHCHSESHPVYAMGVRQEDESSVIETWDIFVRNWGNEGYCSQYQHYVDFPESTYSVLLPWKPGALSVLVSGTFFWGNINGISGSVTTIENRGVVLSFQLPAPEDRPLVDGELRLQWYVPPHAVDTHSSSALLIAALRASSREHSETHEELVREMERDFTPAQRLLYADRLSHVGKPTIGDIPIKVIQNPRNQPEVLPGRFAQVRNVLDKEKARIDEQRAQTLKTFVGDLPDAFGKVSEAESRNRQRLTHIAIAGALLIVLLVLLLVVWRRRAAHS